MKLTNGEIFDSRDALQSLVPQKMPVKTSFELLKIIQVLNPVLIPIQEMYQKLVKEYGEPTPDGKAFGIPETILIPDEAHEGRMLMVPNPKSALFQKDWDEVRLGEIEVKFNPIKLPDNVEISPLYLMALEKFIKA